LTRKVIEEKYLVNFLKNKKAGKLTSVTNKNGDVFELTVTKILHNLSQTINTQARLFQLEKRGIAWRH
jgi:hypothetical protein